MSTLASREQAHDSRLLFGQQIARDLEVQAAASVATLRAAGIVPQLAVLFQGEHADAASYRRMIGRRAARIGIAVREVNLPEAVSETRLLATVRALNEDASVHAVLVQNPLADAGRTHVAETLSSAKDVDGVTPALLGRLMLSDPAIVPCTPAAVLALIESRIPDLKGQRVVIVNASPTVGRPLSQILLNKRTTVTVCASATANLPVETRQAAILIVAVGHARFFGPEYIAPGTLVIDVGINEDPINGGICGDVDLEAVLPLVSAITPVPGGVGPVTTAMVLANTVELARLRHGAGA